jgi:hypothetical protein
VRLRRLPGGGVVWFPWAAILMGTTPGSRRYHARLTPVCHQHYRLVGMQWRAHPGAITVLKLDRRPIAFLAKKPIPLKIAKNRFLG